MKINNLIIDGTNLEHKIFYIARKNIKISSDGYRIELVEKFLQSFRKLIDRFNPDSIYIAWDKKDAPGTNFRKEGTDGYKAGRSRVDDIDELYKQELLIARITSIFGAKNMYPNKLEADDIVAWLSHNLEGNNIVVSGDHDLLQLVNNTTSLWNLKQLITITNFKQIYGIDLNKFLIYKAIKGDSSDNISGLKGYGKIRSKALAESWPDVSINSEERNIINNNIRLMDLAQGYLIQDGEERHYQDQYNKLLNHHGNIDDFINICKYLNFELETRHETTWRHLFKRNNLIDIINSLSVKEKIC